MCYCDLESPKVYSEAMPVARKEHKCSECGNAIQKGQQYRLVKGLWDEHYETYKTCSDCIALLDEAEKVFDCFCCAFTELHSTVKDYAGDYGLGARHALDKFVSENPQ